MEQSDAAGVALSFVALRAVTKVSECTVWTAPPHPDADVFPLADGQFMLGALRTAEFARGKGYATALVGEVCRIMFDRGFTEGIAVVWHSNSPSLSTFRRSGWLVLSRVLLLKVKGAKNQIRIEQKQSGGLSFKFQRPEPH